MGEGEVVYSVDWNGEVVTFPPVGGAEAGTVSFTSFGDGETQLARFALASFESVPVDETRIAATVVLIPRPDNPYDAEAVSVAAPKSMGGDKDARHLGFLYRSFIGKLGDQAIPRLAALSGGEIFCTAVIERDTGSDYNRLDPNDPDDLRLAYSNVHLDLPRAAELGRAIRDFFIANGLEEDDDDEARQFTNHVLERLRSFDVPEIPLGPLSVVVCEGRFGDLSSLTVRSGDTSIGSVAMGYLFLDDERLREATLDGLSQLGVPAAQPRSPRTEAVGNSAWPADAIPHVHVEWRPGGMKLRWAEPEGPSTRTTFAQYNPTTKTLWVSDDPLMAPACVIAARLGIEVAEVGLPPERWNLSQVGRRRLRDLAYEWTPDKPKFKPLSSSAAQQVPGELFDERELERFAQPGCKAGDEPTELLEKLTTYRGLLFPGHSYLETLGTCRICERPAGEFRTPICREVLAYCHRCLAFASDGLPNMSPKRTTARAVVAVKELARTEFEGAAFVEPQLATVHGEEDGSVAPSEIDRRILLRIAITRGQVAWTRVLIDAGLADDGIRLSRGTVLKAVDGHLCLSMQEKAVDDFFHQHGIKHDREPLYPFDKELNPGTRRRADWLLDDGTFVEMWGMPDEPRYAEKMREKAALAVRHGVRLIELTSADLIRLREIFAEWVRQ